MALTVGQLVAYMTVDDTGLQQGSARAEQTMQQVGRSITQTTERAGQQAGQGLAQGIGGGAQDAARLAQQGLGDMAQQAGRAGTQAGQQAGQGLSQGLGQSAQQAGQQAGQQLGASLGSAAGPAGQAAGQQAGQALDASLGNAAQQAGQSAAAQTTAGLSGITGGASAAGAQAGAALDQSLGAIAQHAGRQAGQDAGQALTHELSQGGQDAGEAGADGLKDGLSAGEVGAAAAGALLGASFMAAFGEVMERERVTDRLNAQLGATGAAAKQYGSLAGTLWKDAVVETVQEGADVIKGIVQQGLMPPNATNSQLESIATKIADVSNLLEEDFGRTSMAVSSMLKNGLVKSAEEATDVLAFGLQQGVNKGEDLLDTFAEYSPFFRQLGLDAETSLGILKQGLEGGAWNSDILADSLKEGLLIMQGMAPPAADAIAKIGLNADEMKAAFNRGGPAARTALEQVLTGLRGIEDPTMRNTVALALFGTKLEDTQAALFALDPTTAAQGMDGLAGAAERAGETMRDSAAVNMEKFKRSVQQGLVDFIGGEVLPKIMELAQWAGRMWEGIPEGGKEVVQILGLAALAVAGVTLVFTLGRAAVGAYQTMLAALSAQATVTSATMRILQASMGILGLAAVAVTTVMSLFSDTAEDNTAIIREGTEAVERDSGVIAKNSKEWALNKLSRDGILATAERLQLSLKDVTEASQGNAEAQARVNAALNSGASSWNALKGVYEAQGRTWTEFLVDQVAVKGAIGDTSGALAEGTEAWRRQHEALGESGAQATEAAAAQAEVTKAAEDQEKAVKDLKSEWDALNGVALDSMQAQDDLEASVDDLTASLQENGLTIDAGTEKGRSNRAAMREMVEASYAMAEAKLQETGSTQEANSVLAIQQERFRGVLREMGYTQEQINALVGQYYRIPGDVGTDIRAETRQADAAISLIRQRLDGLPDQVTIDVGVSTARAAAALAAFRASAQADGSVLSFADGGLLPPRSIRAYAEGQHVAQIARAGDWRVWAEDETGGESYIPLALSKRVRSTAILAETARRFGYQLAPAERTVGGPVLVGAGAQAAGASTAAPNSATAGGRSVTVHIEHFYADGQSEQQVAESLWWEATKRGA